MRAFVLSWSAFTTLVAATAAGQAPSGCGPSDSAAATLIRQRLRQWVEQNNRGDRTGASSIWAANVVGWFPTGAEFSDSAAAAAAQVKPGGPRPTVTYQVEVDDVAVSGGLAAVHDIWRERREFPGQSAAVERVIHGSELWRCQPDGTWKIARWVSAPEHWAKK